ncbi:MAG: glycosyltransferase family A protein [Chloroflexota bacterium]
MPRFSVIVPAFDAASTLEETLDAVVAQAFVDWECVVVDDGSTDATYRIATDFADRDARIRAIHQDNQGTAGAYNAGVSGATGDFIVICSADDILLPEHLASMAAFIDAEPGFDIYSTNGFFGRPDGTRELVYRAGTNERVRSMSLSEVIANCFYSVGATYRRSLFEEVGGYRPGVYGEDYDFWLRAMAGGARHRYLAAATSVHRQSDSQKSARFETVYRSDIRLYEDLRRDFDLDAEALRAIAAAIRDREDDIARLHRAPGFVRDVARPAVRRLLVIMVGERRTQRIARAVSRALLRLGLQ